MSTPSETHSPKHHASSNWNVVRSKAIPSNVSGSHKAAAPATSPQVSGMRGQQGDETLTLKARKSPALFSTAESPISKS